MLSDEPIFCACGCGKFAHDWHHCLIHRIKRFPYLNDKRNLVKVNHEEHIARKFDTQEWRRKFWQFQVNQYGIISMMEWVNNLPPKLDRSRIDFLAIPKERNDDKKK